jgi:hypothetical protein
MKNKNFNNFTLTEWFDIRKQEHLEAYVHLCQKGTWPQDFLPENIVMDTSWQMELMGLMSKAWVDFKLKGWE